MKKRINAKDERIKELEEKIQVAQDFISCRDAWAGEDDDSEDFPFYEMNYKNHALPEDFHVSKAVQEANFLCETLVIHVEFLEVKRMTKHITKETGIYKVTVEKL